LHNLDIQEIISSFSTRPEGLTNTKSCRPSGAAWTNEIMSAARLSTLAVATQASVSNYFHFVLLFASHPGLYGPATCRGKRTEADCLFHSGIIVLSVAWSFFEEYRAQKRVGSPRIVCWFSKTTVVRAGISQQDRRGGSGCRVTSWY